MYDVLIVGGGLSGLTNALILTNAGLKVVVIEKNSYPFHRVCGEYISNEVKPFLTSIGVDIDSLNPTAISKLLVSSPFGTILEADLKMGGFGISRYTLDNYLYTLAKNKGCSFILTTTVEAVRYLDNQFITTLSNGTNLVSKITIGSYGKRSSLDRKLNRPFFTKRSPYIGVKYHIQTDFPKNKIALHNFKDGYCGISAIENDTYCLCYLTTRENLKKYGTIEEMEKQLLLKNKYLKTIFTNATFLFKSPEVINEISFEKKSTSTNHLLMSGDSAGMIAPLCGNGMAMAIHSAKLLSETLLENFNTERLNLLKIEQEYSEKWEKAFSRRLFFGKKIQDLFGQTLLTEAVIQTVKHTPYLKSWLIRQTHGTTL